MKRTMKVIIFLSFTICAFIFCCSAKTTTGSIAWWCTQTPHYQTCNHYIPSTNNPISINHFLHITVKAAINESHAVLQKAKRIESKYPNVPGKSLWRSCLDYFDGVGFTLNQVLDQSLQPTPHDVHTWLSAGLTYISVCQKGFEMINHPNPVLLEISTNLTELILNSLAISVAITRSSSSSGEWDFSDDYKLSNLADVVVAKDGSGNFTTVQEAVDSAGYQRGEKRYVIYVKSGVYEEHVVIPKEVTFITVYGDGINQTIITGDRHLGGDMKGSPLAGDLKNSATFQVWGERFIGRDLTFRNTAGPEGEQAVAFLSGSDKSALYHCSIEGYQDTLYAYHSKQFYKECQIFGTVDFIFGDAQAVFQDCEIFLRKPLPGGGLVVTAHGRKFLNESSGFSLQGCKITAADDLKPVIGQYNKAFLGRPWFPYARTVYMQSLLNGLVDPQGWLDTWGYNLTAYCGEYNNYGPGSSTDQRVKWQNYHVITDSNIAKQFTVAEFITGEEWLPISDIPYISGLENL